MNPKLIEKAFYDKQTTPELEKQVLATLKALNEGQIRVCEKKQEGQWQVNEWVKKAILIYFKMTKS